MRPHIFWGHGAVGDLLCLQSCPIVQVGKMYCFQLGRIITNESPHTGFESYSYDNLPYLEMDGKGGISAWQILELCSGRSAEGCLEMSTVHSRE
jgi:hypothetical protein